MRYLLDTNMVSEVIRETPDPRVLERFAAAAATVSTAAPAWYELDVGRHMLPAGKRRRALDAALERVFALLDILPYDGAAAIWHAEQHARLVRLGRTPSYLDAQIAAVAATNNLVLVTRNVRDFRGFEGLDIESWFDA
jgi:tRNA(fMet)-specific endonuclease VapC